MPCTFSQHLIGISYWYECPRRAWRRNVEGFCVNTGVKQGFVLAPVIFKLFLVEVTLVFRDNIFAADGVRIKCRFDGSLFNIRRLQAATKVINDTIFDLQCVGDAALVSHKPDGCSDSQMQTLLHTLVQDWSLTPKRRKSFTSHQIRRHDQLFYQWGPIWPH